MLKFRIILLADLALLSACSPPAQQAPDVTLECAAGEHEAPNPEGVTSCQPDCPSGQHEVLDSNGPLCQPHCPSGQHTEVMEVRELDSDRMVAHCVDDPDVRARKEAEKVAAARKAAEEQRRQQVKQAEEAKRNFHRNYCKHGQNGTVLDVLGGNPYTNSDKCYQLLAFVVQWLGPTSALMNIDFSNTPALLIKVDFFQTTES